MQPDAMIAVSQPSHSHEFLGVAHDRNGRRTWAVIALCIVTMVVEIVGGNLFGSIAVVADGLHMSTHAGGLSITAIAYRYARAHCGDPKFTFGTGKLGDLVGFASAIVLMMFALLIAYESVDRLLSPVAIDFDEAIYVALGGLAVNLVSAALLGHGHDHDREAAELAGTLETPPPVPAHAHRDNNIRAVYIHIMTDAAVSVLAIAGLMLGRSFGWVWMDPLMGIAGAVIIARWSLTLARDTGSILVDVNADQRTADRIRALIEDDGGRVEDLHLWRLGPGHLGLILAVRTSAGRPASYYHRMVGRFPMLSHVTVEVRPG